MLFVSRKDFELLIIGPDTCIDPQLTLGELFAQGPIRITIFKNGKQNVTVGVVAPRQLSISHYGSQTD